MDKKKLIKRIALSFGLSNIMLLMFSLIFLSAIVGMIQQKKNSGDEYSDIGALGVPTEYVEYFNEASKLTGIPNWVLCGIAKQESNFNPNCEYGGAYGMMRATCF